MVADSNTNSPPPSSAHLSSVVQLSTEATSILNSNSSSQDIPKKTSTAPTQSVEEEINHSTEESKDKKIDVKRVPDAEPLKETFFDAENKVHYYEEIKETLLSYI